MRPFSYLRATSVESAVAASSEKTRLLAGGVDLLGQLKEGLVEAETVVAIARIPGLDRIERAGDGWRIGANVTVARLEADAQIRAAFPGLAEAAAEVGSPQIRNVATVGGNLAQRSRCWYFRQRDVQCLKKGGATCFAREGENKYHSLFTGNPCISPCVSNLAIALAALDATAVVQGPSGEKRVSIADLYATAWVNPLADNSLRPGEMITAVELPVTQAACVYLQQSEKSAFDWALVSCAASARLANGVVQSARIVLGAVAPIPYRNEQAEKALVGRRLDETSAAAVAETMLERSAPLQWNGYKVPIARALVRRALLQLAK